MWKKTVICRAADLRQLCTVLQHVRKLKSRKILHLYEVNWDEIVDPDLPGIDEADQRVFDFAPERREKEDARLMDVVKEYAGLLHERAEPGMPVQPAEDSTLREERKMRSMLVPDLDPPIVVVVVRVTPAPIRPNREDIIGEGSRETDCPGFPDAAHLGAKSRRVR